VYTSEAWQVGSEVSFMDASLSLLVTGARDAQAATSRPSACHLWPPTGAV